MRRNPLLAILEEHVRRARDDRDAARRREVESWIPYLADAFEAGLRDLTPDADADGA